MMSQTQSQSRVAKGDLVKDKNSDKSFREKVDECEERISSAIAKLTIDNMPFFGVLLSSSNKKPAEGVGTMGTDGDDILYEPEYVLNISMKELLFSFGHEAMHIALEHFIRKEDRDDEKWNIAADIAVNNEIERSNPDLFEFAPDGIITSSKYKGMSAEGIYNRLDDNEMERYLDSSFQGDQPGGEEDKRGDSENFDKHLKGPSENSAKHRDVQDRVIDAVDMSRAEKGDVPGRVDEKVKELKEGEVKWERMLKQYAGSTLARDEYSALPPNRKWLNMLDVGLPSMRSDKAGRLVVSVDTSGSISSSQLESFASELDSLQHMVEYITLIIADCSVHEVVRTGNIRDFLMNGTWHGRGGTSHMPVFNKIEEKGWLPDLFVGFTDGETDVPQKKPPFPVMWLLTEDGSEIPWGKNVIMK